MTQFTPGMTHLEATKHFLPKLYHPDVGLRTHEVEKVKAVMAGFMSGGGTFAPGRMTAK